MLIVQQRLLLDKLSGGYFWKPAIRSNSPSLEEIAFARIHYINTFNIDEPTFTIVKGNTYTTYFKQLMAIASTHVEPRRTYLLDFISALFILSAYSMVTKVQVDQVLFCHFSPSQRPLAWRKVAEQNLIHLYLCNHTVRRQNE